MLRHCLDQWWPSFPWHIFITSPNWVDDRWGNGRAWCMEMNCFIVSLQSSGNLPVVRAVLRRDCQWPLKMCGNSHQSHQLTMNFCSSHRMHCSLIITHTHPTYIWISWDVVGGGDCGSGGGGGGVKNAYELWNQRTLKISTLYQNYLSMYGQDILCGISNVPFEIPHKICYPCMERCEFYLDV